MDYFTRLMRSLDGKSIHLTPAQLRRLTPLQEILLERRRYQGECDFVKGVRGAALVRQS